MSKLSLQAYEEQLDQFLEDEDYDEVIVWSQHLLRKFPKCLSGYRYLAEAALDTGQREEAMDLFRRLLSADPENFVAYAGLAAIYQEDNVYDEAIWHMMRAFELMPDNPVVREQLRDLYEAKDGRRPGRLKLNQAALARVYLRNGEYSLAVEELTTQLQEDSDRIDLRIARAVALWRAGLRQQAVEEAERVLAELPNALRAHLLLGQFYAEESKTDQASEHLQHARALDPSNHMARSLFGEEGVLPQRVVHITTPYAEEEMPAGVEDETDFFGMDEDFIAFGESAEAEWDVETPPIDWRADLRDATQEALADVPSPVPAASAPVEAPAVPFWMQSLREATENELDAVESAAVAPEPAIEPAPAPEPVRPVWRAALREATGEELAQWEPPAVEAVPSVASEPEPEPEGVPDVPAWRAALRQATEDELSAASREAPTIEEEAPPTSEPEVVADIESPAAWHEELRAETDDVLDGAVSEESTPAPEVEETPAAPAPEWRAELRETTEEMLADVAEPRGDADADAQQPWRAELRDTTGDVLEDLEQEPAHTEPEPKPEPTVSPEPALEPEPEVVSEGGDSADLLVDALHAAAAGDEATALEAFQAVFDADNGRDEELALAMRDWVDSGVEGGGPHQLLGDVYRRMGRLQDAVEEYRAALQKT